MGKKKVAESKIRKGGFDVFFFLPLTSFLCQSPLLSFLSLSLSLSQSKTQNLVGMEKGRARDACLPCVVIFYDGSKTAKKKRGEKRSSSVLVRAEEKNRVIRVFSFFSPPLETSPPRN